MYTSRYRSSSPLGARYRSPSATRSFRDSYASSSYESYNSVSTVGSLNPSVRRVQDLNLSSETRFGKSLSPSYLASNTESRWTSQKSSTDSAALSSSSIRTRRDDSLDFSYRVGRPYTPTSLSFRSASRRVDYSDFIKPVLKPIVRDRLLLNKNYVPRSRAEREKDSAPITRDRKLIKFREVSDDVARSTRRKLSWALPDDFESFSIRDFSVDSSDIKNEEHVRSRESSLSRIRSRENSLTRLRSPRVSLTGASSRESSLSRLRSPRTSIASCRSREQSLTDASKPPPVSSEKFSTDRHSNETLVPKSKRRRSSNLASQDIQSKTPAVAPAYSVYGEIVSDRLHSEGNTTLKVGSYDTQSLRRRRRDSRPEQETEENEDADDAVHSRRRRRRSRFLENTDENIIPPIINENEQKSKDKISRSIDKESILKYSKSTFSDKNSSEKSVLRETAQSKGLSCVRDRSPQKEEISVSYILPVPKTRTRSDSNTNLTTVTVNKDASVQTSKNHSRALSKANEVGQENIVSISLKTDKSKFSVELKKNESKLINDVLKLKNDKVMPSTCKRTEIISKEVTGESVSFVVNRNTGKSIVPLKTEDQISERKPLVTASNELSANIRGNKKAIKDEMEIAVSKTATGNRTDKKSSLGIETVSGQDAKTDGTKIPEYTQKKICQEISGQKGLEGPELKLSDAAQKVSEKTSVTDKTINSVSRTEAISSKLGIIGKNESNSTSVVENKRYIPRFAKITVDKADVAIDSKQKQATHDRTLNVDSKFKPLSKDIDAASPKISEKTSFGKDTKVEAKDLKLHGIGSEALRSLHIENDRKEGSPHSPEVPVHTVTTQKHCAEINSFKTENKTAVLKDPAVKFDAALKKDSERELSSTGRIKCTDNTAMAENKNLRLDSSGKATLKHADIHPDNALLKDSDKRIASIPDKSVSSTAAIDKCLKLDITDKASLEKSNTENERKTFIPRICEKTPQKSGIGTTAISKQKQDIEEIRPTSESTTPVSKETDIKIATSHDQYREKRSPDVTKKTADSASEVEAKVSKLHEIKQKEVQSVITENDRKKHIPRFAKTPMLAEKDSGTPVDTISKSVEGTNVENKVSNVIDTKISSAVQKEPEKVLSTFEKNSAGNTAVTEAKSLKLGSTDKIEVQKNLMTSVMSKRKTEDSDCRIKSDVIFTTKDADVKTDVATSKYSGKKLEEKIVDSIPKADVKIPRPEKDVVQKANHESLASLLSEKPKKKDTGVAAREVPVQTFEKGGRRVGSRTPSLPKDVIIESDITVQKASGRTVLNLENSFDTTSRDDGQNSRLASAVKDSTPENEIKKLMQPVAKSPSRGDSEMRTDASSKPTQNTDGSAFKLESKISSVAKDNEVRLNTAIQKDLEKKVTVNVDKVPNSISKTETKALEVNSVNKKAVDVDTKSEFKKEIPRLAKTFREEGTEENVSVFSRRNQDAENAKLQLVKEISSLTKNKVSQIDTTANKNIEKEPKSQKYVSSEVKMESTAAESKEMNTVKEKFFDSIKSETEKDVSKDSDDDKLKKQSQLPSALIKANAFENKDLRLYKKDIHVAENKTSEKILPSSKIPTSIQKAADERIPTHSSVSSFTADTRKDYTESKSPEPKEPTMGKHVKANSEVTNVEIDVRLKIKKGRRVSKDGLPSEAIASIQADYTRKNQENKNDSNDPGISEKPEKFALKMDKIKTASAVAWTGEDMHAADIFNDQNTLSATEFETVDFSLNLKEIVQIPREENIISESLTPVKPVLIDIPITISKADISDIEEDRESEYVSSSEGTQSDYILPTDSVLPKSEFETERKVKPVCEENTSKTRNTTTHSESKLDANRVSPILPQPEETKEDTRAFTKPTVCTEKHESDMTHDKIKPQESTEIYTGSSLPGLKEEQILLKVSKEIFPESPKEAIQPSKISQILETRNTMASPVENSSKHLNQGTSEGLSQVCEAKKIAASFLAGDLPSPRSKTPEQRNASDRTAAVLNGDRVLGGSLNTGIPQIPKEVLLPERTEDKILDSDPLKKKGEQLIQQSKAESCKTDFTKDTIQDNTSKTAANILQVLGKSGHLIVTDVSNKKEVSQLSDIERDTELTASAALSHIPLVTSKSSDAVEKIPECKSHDLKIHDESHKSVESKEETDSVMTTGKTSPAANEVPALGIGKLLSKLVEASAVPSQKVAIKTQSSTIQETKSSGNHVVESEKVLEPNSTECKTTIVCVQETKTPKLESAESVSLGNVNSGTKEFATRITVPEVDSSSEETSSEEEESSSEGEESTSDDDNRLPGNWGVRNANIAPAKKKRFIGLVTKTALNENVASNTEQQTDGRLSESDERARNRSQLSPQRSAGGEDTYVSFSSPFSSPTEVSQRVEESPRRSSSSSQQDRYQKLRFKKYDINDFQFLKLLGKGSFGKVLLAELKGHDLYFAIKCLKKDVVLEDDDVESTMIERRILALGTQHPFMCKLYCTFQTDSHLFFVMEYLNGGDLMFHIQESGRFDHDRARFYAAEITSALKFLHRKGIVYRDMKLDNIVMDEQGHIRLVDFGMCQCRVYKEECMPFNFCGTPQYIAPEIVMGQTYNQSVDWWSFGVLLYEMLTGRSPFNGTDEDELFWSICNEEPHYPRFLTKEARHLIELLLVKSPPQRLGMPACSAGDIKSHPFFAPLNWALLETKQIQPPFKPSIRSASDTSNFDSSFTMDSATLSPVETDILRSMDQTQFEGFSYTNPHITG